MAQDSTEHVPADRATNGGLWSIYGHDPPLFAAVDSQPPDPAGFVTLWHAGFRPPCLDAAGAGAAWCDQPKPAQPVRAKSGSDRPPDPTGLADPAEFRGLPGGTGSVVLRIDALGGGVGYRRRAQWHYRQLPM